MANAVVLPTVTEFNISSNPRKHANIARTMGVDISGMTDEEAAMSAVEEMKRLCEDVGIPKMKELKGMNPYDFPALAEAAMKNVSTPSNPRDVTAKDYLELMQKAYNS